MTDPVNSRREEAAALLMRELICEQIFRERAKWDPDHPSRALGIRTIEPRELLPYVCVSHLILASHQRKAEAAWILDQIVANRT